MRCLASLHGKPLRARLFEIARVRHYFKRRRHSPHTRQRVQPRYAPSASTKSESSGKSTQRKEKPSFFFQLAAFLDGTDRRLFESVLKGAEGRSTDDATDTGPPRDYADSATGKHYRSDSPMPREPADNSTGRGSRLLRDYKILGEIGKGCNGDVRKAEVLPTARAKGGRCHFRAIKAMYQPVDNEVKERLEAAKGVLRSLNDCPNIIYFYTCFTETTTTGTEHLLFVNEYAEGGNLSARIKKNDSLHEKDPLHEQDKKAIIYCKGVEHGVAMRVAEPQGPTTFMAPEVFKRKIIYFSQDIWAFG
ncbi:kinase-like protein [Fomitiporia mediterranea MF3/22]|uniref:kinase-like protein n=1 Tax=Fomitiporia mediterranea (strain MF3/22) TaxID=694068 RepID=UPI00044086B5|nr:kinase-like protein [Fomitiporia mediterranea MF3/22]EJD06443.1 kinase-like protein [Fomitiporia mediterranea MF3/22]